MFACRELAEKHPVSELSPVIINYCNPGMCKTSIYRDDRGWVTAKIIDVATGLLGRDCEVGSRTLVNCVTMCGKESHGKYVNNDQPGKSSSYVESQEGRQMQKQFWDELMAKLEAVAPDVSKNA